jgi:SAM-dependent methyltransferase
MLRPHDPLRSTLARLRESWRYRRQGLYQFSLRYFDRWERRKLARYVHRQLPTEWYRLALVRACADEYHALRPFLSDPQYVSQPPSLVLDLGCGLGRSSIFFMHMLGWHTTKFLFLDSHRDLYGDKRNVPDNQTGWHQDVQDCGNSFYTNFDLLDRLLIANGMRHVDVLDLRTEPERIAEIRDVDLLYSFHSTGYHYAPDAIWKQYPLHDSLRPGALVILGIRRPGDRFHGRLKLDRFLDYGYERLATISGTRLQDFLILRKQSVSSSSK